MRTSVDHVVVTNVEDMKVQMNIFAFVCHYHASYILELGWDFSPMVFRHWSGNFSTSV